MKLGEICNNWYIFDEYGIPRDFDEKKRNQDEKLVLTLPEQLKKEISSVDSGIGIEDYETDFYKSLVENK